MENKEIFAEFAVIILTDLFGSFPVAESLDKKTHLGGVITSPSKPFLMQGLGIYVGPRYGSEWGVTPEMKRKAWDNFDWDLCQKNVESLLERELIPNEKEQLLSNATRPLTISESQELDEWKIQNKSYKENRDQQSKKDDIYVGTVQFLVNEQYIRVVDLSNKKHTQLQPTDFLIKNEFKSLRFTLTNKGYIHMNKKPPMGEDNLYENMKSYVTDKTVDAFVGASADTLLSVFLN